MESPVQVRRLPHEMWAQAYEGYLISNMGRWYSQKSERLLAQHPNSSGYLRADIIVDGKRICPFTHIKVVEFFGDCYGNRIPAGVTKLRDIHFSIDHLDRNKRNNRQSNLELTTHAENCKRKFKNN